MRAVFLSVTALSAILAISARVPAADDKPSATVKPAATGADDPAALFDQLDANHDGQLAAAEIPAEKRGLFERLLRRAGKPANGKLSRDEFVAQLSGKPEPTNGPALVPPANDTPAKPIAGDTPTKPAVTPSPAGPLANLPQVNPERMFERLSKGTGKITLDDVPEPRRPLLRRVFAEAGKPENGSLSKDEFIKAIKAVLAKRAAGGLGPLARPAGDVKPSTDAKSNGDNKSTADGKPAADSKPAPEAPPPGNPAQRLKRLLALSKRSDGKLTKDDLPERLRDRFDKIDANHDGLIDEQELRDWIAKAAERLQAPKNNK